VVFDSKGVEVCLCRGKIEEFDGIGFGVWVVVVVGVELALFLRRVEDALLGLSEGHKCCDHIHDQEVIGEVF